MGFAGQAAWGGCGMVRIREVVEGCVQIRFRMGTKFRGE
jgi:hypothetical protein